MPRPSPSSVRVHARRLLTTGIIGCLPELSKCYVRRVKGKIIILACLAMPDLTAPRLARPDLALRNLACHAYP